MGIRHGMFYKSESKTSDGSSDLSTFDSYTFHLAQNTNCESMDVVLRRFQNVPQKTSCFEQPLIFWKSDQVNISAGPDKNQCSRSVARCPGARNVHSRAML